LGKALQIREGTCRLPTSLFDFVRFNLGFVVLNGKVEIFVNEVSKLPSVRYLTNGRGCALRDMAYARAMRKFVDSCEERVHRNA
jgi:hypothetical protein